MPNIQREKLLFHWESGTACGAAFFFFVFFFLAEAKATAELHVRHDRLTCVTGLGLAFPPSDNSLS